ncbi:MAG: DNA processing chain A [Candidatus Midichloria mitochondrii]|uniref:DNA processing chain A n=1 Tax=Midichloria mitochondrii (strain IricVA) TaxID=696127 RepID=F7XWW5_MIDMI|nr:hypothetical protein [Candidatus Midichloria mitochondrii]AEI89164.1 DNA processing chain A [Candidatus Midichloria mitochondrii IricVA]MDJ1256067.1 hypothetical protein [Candidatus Midichloria mitochondrii]MDJ1287765.1 hypothetical protein [Candidatus Midichloria mitochondrii]MDJ1312615.1 hypothetical protein [Candidatus Midichloria mitochondrii]MDJ1583223.1 hypothetical protein [Candidatus Midichloria mitochondrii]
MSKFFESVYEEQLKLVSWLKLARTPGVSAKTFFELINIFGSSELALSNLNSMARAGGSKKNLEIPSDAAIELEISQCESYNTSIICAFEGLLTLAEELASNLSSAGCTLLFLD